jgi:uncharacterized protein (TIGR01244 family)
MSMRTAFLAALALAIGTGLAALAAPPAAVPSYPCAALGVDRAAPPDSVGDWPGFQMRLWREGRVFIGGQPDSTALAAARDHGVTCVVNFRTPAEMNDRKRVPYDEAALAAALGLDYVSAPIGDAEHPYTPAAVDSVAAALARHDGPVLLHCTVGWRAAHVWVAYLVRHQGWGFAEALPRGERIAITESPLGGLLGRAVRLELGPADPAAGGTAR